MTESQIAYCGLDCSSCPVHLATLEPDAGKQCAMRVSIAHECFEHYGMRMLPEEVNDCDGCRANTGRLFSSCRNCAIRKCASAKELESCAYCDEYACDKLGEMFRLDPEAKSRLEKIRKG
jgi:hypothetical protein